MSDNTFEMVDKDNMVGLDNPGLVSSKSDLGNGSLYKSGSEVVVSVREAMKSYEKKGKLVLNNMNMTVKKGVM